MFIYDFFYNEFIVCAFNLGLEAGAKRKLSEISALVCQIQFRFDMSPLVEHHTMPLTTSVSENDFDFVLAAFCGYRVFLPSFLIHKQRRPSFIP